MSLRVTRASSRQSMAVSTVVPSTPENKKRRHAEIGSTPLSSSKKSKKASRAPNLVAPSPTPNGREDTDSKDQNTPELAQIKVDEETTVSKKAENSAIRKTESARGQRKGDKEDEMKPLAPRTQGLRMFVGAHVSASKGVQNAVTNSLRLGGNAFALFLKSQRKWDNPPLQHEHRDQFRHLCSEHKYDASKYVLPHGSYLVNLAQEDPAKAKQAYNSFLEDLKRCDDLGIKLYNFHPGATGKSPLDSALERLAKSLIAALDATKNVIPVLETMCGHGTSIGGPLSHFKSLLALIPESYHSRLGICLDTCHSFAAGYDLRTPDTWNAFMQEFDETIGLKFLRALHLNDSKTPLGSHRDLHANIGTGFLGLRAFHNVMNDKRLEDIPMILETPIERPANAGKSEANEEAIASECEHEESDISDTEPASRKKQGKAKPSSKATKPAKKKAPMIEDKSVWVREIKLLESLIGMDPESKEFKALESELSREGKAEREKHQEMFDKKKAKEKAKDEKQKDIKAMFGTKAPNKRKA